MNESVSNYQDLGLTKEIQKMNLAEKPELESLGYTLDEEGNLVVKEGTPEGNKVLKLAKYLKSSVTRGGDGSISLNLESFRVSKRKMVLLMAVILMVGLPLSIVLESKEIEPSMDLSPSTIRVDYDSRYEGEEREPEISQGSGLTLSRSGESLRFHSERNEDTISQLFSKFNSEFVEYGINDPSNLESVFDLSTRRGVHLYDFVRTDDGQIFVIYSAAVGQEDNPGAREDVLRRVEERDGGLYLDDYPDNPLIFTNEDNGMVEVSAFPGAERSIEAPSQMQDILGT